jgi:hypothetical protein
LKPGAVGKLAGVLSCSRCKFVLVIGTFHSRVNVAWFVDLVPTKGKTRPKWYRADEYEDIEATFHELSKGDQGVFREWMQRRQEYIRTRHEVPLSLANNGCRLTG